MHLQRLFGTSMAVVIGCFKMFDERASSHCAKSLTWSQYEHPNTTKYSVGTTPQVTVTLVFRGWCGRSSSKLTADNCGISDKLSPGDSTLADRSAIAESVGLQGATLKMSAFTNEKPQLAPWSVQETRNIANVRIHVERAIGLIRNKYAILESTVPVDVRCAKKDSTTALDKIVYAALGSQLNSIVSFN